MQTDDNKWILSTYLNKTAPRYPQISFNQMPEYKTHNLCREIHCTSRGKAHQSWTHISHLTVFADSVNWMLLILICWWFSRFSFRVIYYSVRNLCQWSWAMFWHTMTCTSPPTNQTRIILNISKSYKSCCFKNTKTGFIRPLKAGTRTTLN